MKVIYHVYLDHEEMGELDSFFEIDEKEKLKLIDYWSINDAYYRSEYMSRLFEYLGVIIESLPAKFRKRAAKLVAKNMGLND